jgi:spermidine synthase
MFSNALLFMVSTVRLLGRYQGRNGQIEIVECSWDGTRVYFEVGVRQSQATPDGESVFTYVKIMDELLSHSEHILVLGCSGGNLATRLSRLGKRLTIVDINPISFVLAHRYFDLPDDLPCIVSDFRKFVFDDRLTVISSSVIPQIPVRLRGCNVGPPWSEFRPPRKST